MAALGMGDQSQMAAPNYDAKVVLEYALKYFEIHAGQRMSVFNFFIVLSGIILTGLATCVVGDRAFTPIGVVLGFALTALAWTFWKLDQRTSFLIKRAEHALVEVEREHFPTYAHIIDDEATEFAALNAGLSLPKKNWTYSKSLGIVFIVVAIAGLVGAALSLARATGLVDWFEKPPVRERTDVHVEVVWPPAQPLKQRMIAIGSGAQNPKRDRPPQASH